MDNMDSNILKYQNDTVSIIIPVYNMEKYVEKTILSILNQSYSSFEVIIIDDGSTDDSYSICKKYADEDQRIKLYSQANSGVSAARNAGIKYANGKYLIFVDSDDELLENSIQSRIATLSNAELIITDFYDYYEDSDSLICEREINNTTLKSKQMIKELIFPRKFGYQGYLWNKLFLTQIIKKNRIFFDETIHYNEDRLFIYMYLKKCKHVQIINEKTYKYVHHINSKMWDAEHEVFDDKILTELDAFEIIKKDNVNPKNDIYYLCCFDIYMAVHKILKKNIVEENIKRELNTISKNNYNSFLFGICSISFLFRKFVILFHRKRYIN